MTDSGAEGGPLGRPRSEHARLAVLHAVDDLLVEVGYSAMTMKGIAERAGVGRQTVYRWWTTKAEILLEACVADAREELEVSRSGDLRKDLTRYVKTLLGFLTSSTAGAGWRALLGEAQHDDAVAQLVSDNDVLLETARAVLGLSGTTGSARRRERDDGIASLLVGPVLFWVLSGRQSTVVVEPTVTGCLRALESAPN